MEKVITLPAIKKFSVEMPDCPRNGRIFIFRSLEAYSGAAKILTFFNFGSYVLTICRCTFVS
jgi:hypothetical protein